ncbi:hypothetical protein [Chloroflexus sp.]|uniref:hypothetical protein n=1 Tax=Chloroflexus sp. TaxID=1904827 RepID=UPI0026219420|nr:hypothetical protein [uncultured Chloroflexus sp.]
MEMEYSLALALEDYLPVIFSIIGVSLIARTIWQLDRPLGMMAFVGVGLMAVGGVLKATWKLLMAINGTDVPLFSQALFPMIAPGFTLIAMAVYSYTRQLRGKAGVRWPWLAPLIVISLFVGGSALIAANGGPWRVPLIMLATIANVALLLMLAVGAWRRNMRPLAVVFVVVLLVVIGMSQMASNVPQTIAVQWFEQIAQTLAQLAFCLGVWQLTRRMAQEAPVRQLAAGVA